MKNIIIIVVLIFAISGCKKKETTPAKTKTELLTAHYWKLTAMTVDPPLLTVTDLYAQMSPCAKDDIQKYNTNNTVVYDEGATKCDAADPQTTTSSWTFNSTETIITEDGENENVLNLTENELKLSYIFTDNGINYTVTATFAKN